MQVVGGAPSRACQASLPTTGAAAATPVLQAYLNVEAVKGVTRDIKAEDADKVHRPGCGWMAALAAGWGSRHAWHSTARSQHSTAHQWAGRPLLHPTRAPPHPCCRRCSLCR